MRMDSIVQTIALLSKVVIAFFLLYVFIPSRVIRFDKEKNSFDLLDRIFICLIHANLVTIVLVHLLAMTGIYEAISLIVAYLLVIIGYRWISNRSSDPSAPGGKVPLLARGLDSIENHGSLFNSIKNKTRAGMKSLFEKSWEALKRFAKNPLAVFLVIAVFILGAIVRFSHSVQYVYYGASDPYVHLAWTKYLGYGDIYRDGVYPLGYNAIISAMSKTFFIDPHTTIRFIGALGGCLIIFSIYYIVRKSFKNAVIPAIFAVAVYVAGTQLPNDAWRQMSALPQEYGMIFILPGMYFLVTYFKNKEKKYLYLAAEVMALTLLIHTYDALILGIGFFFICLLNIRSFFNLRFTARFTATMIVSAVVGLLPIGIGLLSGKKMHQMSIDFIIASVGTTEGTAQKFNLFGYMETDPALIAMLVAMAALTVLSLIGLFYKKEENQAPSITGLTVALVTLVLYLLYRSEYFGIPALMDKSRSVVFMVLTAVAMFGMLIGMIGMIPVKKIVGNIFKIMVCAVLAFYLFNAANFSIPVGSRYEYDEAAYSYMQIKQDYPTLNWTIISPVEQYDQVLDYGRHYQLFQFIKDLEVDKKSEVVIPTDYVFWYVEKIPLNTTLPISEADAAMDFPTITGNDDEYYTKAANRRIIEAKAYYWLEDYRSKNKDMTIYLDTENLRIYMLKQDGTNPINFAK